MLLLHPPTLRLMPDVSSRCAPESYNSQVQGWTSWSFVHFAGIDSFILGLLVQIEEAQAALKVKEAEIEDLKRKMGQGLSEAQVQLPPFPLNIMIVMQLNNHFFQQMRLVTVADW